MSDMELSEDEWRKKLTNEEYKILRQKGTERAFSGEYWDKDDDGIYKCRGCGTELFSSDTKYKSGSGWPSFYDALSSDAIETKEDRSAGMVRTEIVCSNCGSHLGHLFNDGPKPTGKRYCVNSKSLKFEDQ